MSLIRRVLLALAALPLLYLPLRAAETPTATPPEAEQPAAPPEKEEKAEPAEVEPAKAPPREPEPGERLSLDNNISFPVDI